MDKQLPLPEVVTASAFRLKDENGLTRALLTTLDGGRPTLLLFDDKGQSRIEVGLQTNGAPKFVLNCENDITLVVEVSQDKQPVFQVLNNGQPAAFQLKQMKTA